MKGQAAVSPDAGRASTRASASSSRAIFWLRLSVVAAIIVPLAILAVTAWSTRDTTIANAKSSVSHSVAALSEHALKVIETHNLVLHQIDDQMRNQSCDDLRGVPDLQRFLSRAIAHTPQIRAVWVLDNEGYICGASNPALIDDKSRADRDYFIQAQKTGRLVIGRAMTGRINPTPVVPLSIRRSSAAGQFTGIIFATVGLSYFAEYYRSVAPAQEHRIALYRADGALLALSPSTAPPPSPAVEARIAPLFAIPEGVRHGPSVIDDVRRISAWKVLPEWGVAVTYSLGEADVLREWRGTMTLFALVALLASSALVGVSVLALRWVRREQDAARRQVEAEAALRERDALHASIFQKTADAVFVVAARPGGRLVFETVNPAFELHTGLRAEDVVGRRPDEIYEPDDAGPVVIRCHECLAGGVPISFSTALTFGGRRTMWQASLTPVPDSDDRIVRLVGTMSNITLQRDMEERLRQAQQMEAVGRLAGGIAHDFNNLLTVIMGNLEFLLSGAVQERQRKLIGAATKAAQRAAALTRQMLSFGRRQMLRPGLHDVNDLLRDIEGLIQGTMTQAIALNYQLQDGSCVCSIDRTEFELAILNIAVNARHAMPGGGTLTIRTETVHVDRSASRLAASLASGDYVRITLSDTGHGMPEEVRTRAFEPFFTTRPLGEGSGLGLSQVYGFASQSGGVAELDSLMGDGTSVSLYLPSSDQKGERTIEQGAGAVAARTLTGTVLLVEDEPAVRTTIAAILEHAGCTVLQAADAAEALRVLHSQDRPIDLLLTDIVMSGGMSGVTLADRVKQAFPGVKVMVMTGYAEVAAAADGHTLLKKPFRGEDLVVAVQAALGD